MTTEIDQAREAIERQLKPIARKATELEKELAALRQTESQLRAALKALAQNKPIKSKAGRKPAKPCARKEDVLKVCLAIATEQSPRSPISKAELERLVKQKLSSECGFSLSGVSPMPSTFENMQLFIIFGTGFAPINQVYSTPDKMVLKHAIT